MEITCLWSVDQDLDGSIDHQDITNFNVDLKKRNNLA